MYIYRVIYIYIDALEAHSEEVDEEDEVDGEEEDFEVGERGEGFLPAMGEADTEGVRDERARLRGGNGRGGMGGGGGGG